MTSIRIRALDGGHSPISFLGKLALDIPTCTFRAAVGIGRIALVIVSFSNIPTVVVYLP